MIVLDDRNRRPALPAVPVPVALTVCGPPVPLLTTVSAALRKPAAPGLNVKLNEQDVLGLTVAHVELVTVNSDGLLLLMLDTETGRPADVGDRDTLGAAGRANALAPEVHRRGNRQLTRRHAGWNRSRSRRS